jgi:anti-sigma-K factor RsiG
MTDDERFRGAEGRGERPGEELGGVYELGEEPDLIASISAEELMARLEDLSEEERAISYRRRVIQGRIELIPAELVRHGRVTLSPEELARVLLGAGRGRGVT